MFWVFVKSIVITLFVITAISLAAWFYQSQPNQSQMQTWLNSTQGLLDGAKVLFPTIKQPEEDEKLQALLPTDQLDLSYRSDETSLGTTIAPQQGSVPSISISDARKLLPDMFNPQAQPSTSIKGNVHTDENDNIIGAEVHLAIPAGM